MTDARGPCRHPGRAGSHHCRGPQTAADVPSCHQVGQLREYQPATAPPTAPARVTTQLRHPKFGYTLSYRRAVELQARILAARLLGELPAYEPLVTR